MNKVLSILRTSQGRRRWNRIVNRRITRRVNNAVSFRRTATPPKERGFWHASWAYWICQGAGWTLYFCLQVGTGPLLGLEPLTARAIVATFVASASGLILTHLVRQACQSQDWLSLSVWKLLLRVSVAAFIAGLIMTGAVLVVTVIANHFGLAARPPIKLPQWLIIINNLVNFAFLVFTWEGIYLVVEVFRRHQREETERWKLEAALASAELGTLKAQLNPHFLFNCLNGLRALVVEDPERAQYVITRLASVLRYSLQSSSTPTVTLERELQTVDDYLDLEAIRFEDRLRVRREIDPTTLTAQVPPMVVQTLVENAIKYGISKYPDAGEIVIASSLTNEELVVTITNNGQIEQHSESTGLGLKNAADRLRRLFGRSASISLVQSRHDLVTAMIRLPVHARTALGVRVSP